MGYLDKVLGDLEKRRKDTELKISEVQARIDESQKLDAGQCNNLIIQYLAYEINLPHNRDCRYGQILRNTGIIKEVSAEDGTLLGWHNDYYTPSSEFMARLGDPEYIRVKVARYLRHNSGLRAKNQWNDPPERIDYNKMINNLLLLSASKYPDLQFGQLLRNLEIVKEDLSTDRTNRMWVNDFNTESEYILKRVKNYEELLRKKDAPDV